MKIWTLLTKNVDHEFIHTHVSTYSSLKKAQEAVYNTTSYKSLSEGGKYDVKNELEIDGVVEVCDYQFVILESEVE